MATKTRRKLTELGITTILFVVGTLGAYAFSAVGLHIESAFMLFVLGVIITTMETDSPGWGIGLSLLYLLVYDFLLTDPRFTLKMANPNFYISYIVFIIVAFASAIRASSSVFARTSRYPGTDGPCTAGSYASIPNSVPRSMP